MTREHFEFTSESVSEGHPDKVADRISDEILDLYLEQSIKAGMSPWDVRVAAETLTTTNKVVIAGEVRGHKSITNDLIQERVRRAIKDIGYAQDGFHWESVDIDILLHAQSVDIAQGVDHGTGLHASEGAGDQGIMFGYACQETPDLMPAPIYYSHKILERLAKARKIDGETWLGPDAKCQLTVRYAQNKPVGISALVLSTQHLDENLTSPMIAERIKPYILEVLPEGWVDDNTVWHINPTGKFVIGGPDGDCGLTGRKIIVDTYGGAAPHGGGAFSGKDATKVDRSAAYMARYLAKNIVAAGISNWVNIQLSYAIGVAHPTSIYVDMGGNGTVDENTIETIIPKIIDLTPRGIRTHLGLNHPIFSRTSAYGHFGRKPDADGGFSWEKLDLIDTLTKAL